MTKGVGSDWRIGGSRILPEFEMGALVRSVSITRHSAQILTPAPPRQTCAVPSLLVLSLVVVVLPSARAVDSDDGFAQVQAINKGGGECLALHRAG